MPSRVETLHCRACGMSDFYVALPPEGAPEHPLSWHRGLGSDVLALLPDRAGRGRLVPVRASDVHCQMCHAVVRADDLSAAVPAGTY